MPRVKNTVVADIVAATLGAKHTPDENCALMSALHLSAMKAEYQNCLQEEEFTDLPFDDKVYRLLKAELDKREQSGYLRRRKGANLPSNANVGVILERLDDYRFSRDRLERFMSMRWIDQGHLLLITGATGLGKTDLGAAICDQAIRLHKKAICYPYDLFVMSLCDHCAQGKQDEYQRALKQVSSVDVLMLDDVCTGIQRPCEAIVFKDVLDLIRQKKIGLILTSQASLPEWHKFLGGGYAADAVLDRINGSAERIELTGDSKRILREFDDKNQQTSGVAAKKGVTKCSTGSSNKNSNSSDGLINQEEEHA